MSNAIFPPFLGLSFDMEKEPIGGLTNIQTSVSGKENRLALWSLGSSRYNIKLIYEFLWARQKYAASNQVALPSSLISPGLVMANDYDALKGFFLARQGAFDDFLYSDPDEDPAVQSIFGIGDGTSTVFQLYKPAGGSPLTAGPVKELIQNVNGTPTQPAGSWAASTSYPSTTLILPSNDALFLQSGRRGALTSPGWPLWFRSGGGTSGTVEPLWVSASIVGQTIPGDGSVTWTCMGVPFVIYVNGTIQATSAYTLSSVGVVTFSSPPANNAVLAWTGDYYYRCRFEQDLLNFKEFMQNFYEAGEVNLVSVKL